MAGASRVVRVVRRAVAVARARNVPFMAGSVAYQAFLSLVPLLALTVFFVSVAGGTRLATGVLSLARSVVPAGAMPVVRAALRIRPDVGASVVGVVTLLWGSFRVFRGLDTAFAEIYGTADGNALHEQIADAAVAAVALVGAVLVAVAATVAFRSAGVAPTDAATGVLAVGALTAAFVPMYWWFPDADLRIREAVPGAVVAAAGWALLQLVFELYVAVAAAGGAAGVLGAVLLLLVWLYFGSLALLVGATVNAVAADRVGTGE